MWDGRENQPNRQAFKLFNEYAGFCCWGLAAAYHRAADHVANERMKELGTAAVQFRDGYDTHPGAEGITGFQTLMNSERRSATKPTLPASVIASYLPRQLRPGRA
jgi:hypothetical protein